MSLQAVYTKVFVIRSAIFLKKNYWSLTMVYYSLVQSYFLELVYGVNFKSNDVSEADFRNVLFF